MGIKKDYEWVQQVVKKYKAKLEEIDDSVWQTTPPIQGWSYSEVYYHIFDASMLSLLQLNDCAVGKGKVKPTAFAVKFILFIGMLPPGKKFVAPKTLTDRLKKVGKDEVLQMIETFLKQLQLAYPKIRSADLSIKAAHPKMGYLNAAHWLRFIGIHLNHHLKQLNRIDKSFKSPSLQQ
jgi:hypothetical protein